MLLVHRDNISDDPHSDDLEFARLIDATFETRELKIISAQMRHISPFPCQIMITYFISQSKSNQ